MATNSKKYGLYDKEKNLAATFETNEEAILQGLYLYAKEIVRISTFLSKEDFISTVENDLDMLWEKSMIDDFIDIRKV